MPSSNENRITRVERVVIWMKSLPLPFIVLWRLLVSFFDTGRHEKEKPWRRIASDAAFRWTVYSHSVREINSIMDTTMDTYERWCRRHRADVSVDQIGDFYDARLLWVGEFRRRPERVVMYIHGGGFYLPLADYAIGFWRYVQGVLGSEGVEVGVVMLDYSLAQEADFPTQLRQTVAAINFLRSTGTKLENLQLTGDSAGANLCLQLLLHIIHPVEGVPLLDRGTKFGGVYFMSPWVVMVPSPSAKSYAENDGLDVISAAKFKELGLRVRKAVIRKDPSFLPYVDQSCASPMWYEGIEETVGRVLITAGGAECIRDDIVEFARVLGKFHGRVVFVLDRFGVHDDPFYDVLAGERERLSEVTPVIVQWLKEGFLDVM